jgi:hypothetical protein
MRLLLRHIEENNSLASFLENSAVNVIEPLNAEALRNINRPGER